MYVIINTEIKERGNTQWTTEFALQTDTSPHTSEPKEKHLPISRQEQKKQFLKEKSQRVFGLLANKKNKKSLQNPLTKAEGYGIIKTQQRKEVNKNESKRTYRNA